MPSSRNLSCGDVGSRLAATALLKSAHKITELFGLSSKYCRTLQCDIYSSCVDNVQQWLSKNSLLLSTAKTKAITIGHKSIIQSGRKPSLYVNMEKIDYFNTARNLGVLFDTELSFKAHIGYVARVAGQKLANLGKVCQLMPQSTLQQVVQSLVMSAVLFNISVWSTFCASTLAPLQRVQNWAARIVSGCRKFDHVSDVIRELKLLRISEEAELLFTAAAYSAMKGSYSADMIKLFQELSSFSKAVKQRLCAH